MQADSEIVVLGLGSSQLLAGVSGDDMPRYVVPSVIGVPRIAAKPYLSGLRDFYCGDEAESKRGILRLRRVMERGTVCDFADVEKLYNYAIMQMMSAENNRVIVADAPNTPKAHREKTAEIMFESFGFEGMFIDCSSVFSLIASGRLTGVVLECGFGFSAAVPIYEGQVINHAVRMTNFAGGHLDDYKMHILEERGYSFTTTAEREIVRDIKEKLGYVALDFDAEMELSVKSSSIEKSYDLPDAACICIGNERFRCPELLFQPSHFLKASWTAELWKTLRYLWIGRTDPESPLSMLPKDLVRLIQKHFLNTAVVPNWPQFARRDNFREMNQTELCARQLGIHQLLYSAISAVDVELHHDMFANVVLTGGSTLFPGLCDRLQKELSILAPSARKIKVIAPPERKYSTWIGASIWGATIRDNDAHWVLKEEYDEWGPKIINIKCF